MNDLTAFLNARLDEDEAMVTEPHIWPTTFRPERVLREVAADRRLLAEWQKAEADPAIDDQWNAGFAAGLRLAVQIRTARYGGHPDYRQEWKP